MKIILNGEEKTIREQISIAELISELELDTKKIAVEKDLEIIHPNRFHEVKLKENNRIEIVHFIGGG